MNWIAEVKQVFIRRANEYGEPYTGVAVLTLSDDKVLVELMKADEFTKDDRKAIQNIISEHWPDKCYTFNRYKKITRGN